MKKIWTFLTVIVLIAGAILLGRVFMPATGPGEDMDYPIPEEGKWYCEELQGLLVRDRDARGIAEPSSILVDGETISCSCGTEINTPYLFLRCKETDNARYSLGETIYWWVLVEADENEMTLEDYKTGEVYHFGRIDSE